LWQRITRSYGEQLFQKSTVAVVVAAGELLDPVSTTVIGVPSGVEGGHLSLHVSWVKNCLIFEVTKGASGFRTVMASYIVASRVGLTAKAFSVEASIEMSIALESMISFFTRAGTTSPAIIMTMSVTMFRTRISNYCILSG